MKLVIVGIFNFDLFTHTFYDKYALFFSTRPCGRTTADKGVYFFLIIFTVSWYRFFKGRNVAKKCIDETLNYNLRK